MDDALLTAGQLAEAVGVNEDDADIILRRVRHWSATELLQPVTGTHTGPGRHRRYAAATVYLVALLNALADMSLPIGVLKKAAKEICRIGVIDEVHRRLLRSEPESVTQAFYADKDRERRLWEEAIAGSRPVFVTISFPAGDVANDELLAMLRVEVHPVGEMHKAAGAFVDSLIAVDATRVFKRISLS